MILVESVLGNRNDPQWGPRLAAAAIDELALDHWEAQKNRFRKKTAGGTELAVSLDRGAFIRDGDVLLWDEAAQRAVIARISLRDVMVINLDALAAAQPDIALRTCIELGHAMGNQHWPALVKGGRVFVPLTVDRKVMSSVMNTHRFEGIRYEFMPGSEIVPYLAPHESRRLFGGAEGPVHTHTHEKFVAIDEQTGEAYGRPPVRAQAQAPAHDHVHAHEHTYEHSHEHTHGHDHGHDHTQQSHGHTHDDDHAHDHTHDHAHDGAQGHRHRHGHGKSGHDR